MGRGRVSSSSSSCSSSRDPRATAILENPHKRERQRDRERETGIETENIEQTLSAAAVPNLQSMTESHSGATATHDDTPGRYRFSKVSSIVIFYIS
jgi:hypothetical protein